MADELDDVRAELTRVTRALEAERRNSQQWQQVAEERRAALERVRQHPAVRLAFWVAGFVLPPLRRGRARARRLLALLRRLGGILQRLPRNLTARQREQALRRDVGRLPDPPPADRSVSVVIVTRSGGRRLARLLTALATRHRDVEVVVHANAVDDDTRAVLDHAGVTTTSSDVNLPFAEANNRAAAASAGELLLFLNDDVEAVGETWLDQMVAALEPDVAAVGAQLVYSRRGVRGAAHPDLTVQHLGIRFGVERDRALPRAHHLGRGQDPRVGGEPTEVAAVTAACLLVRRSDFEAVGGFPDGYDYGTEDVDLCWRLRARGRIVVEPRAVFLHDEGATRLAQGDADARRARQERNWVRFEERHGPAVDRAVALDRVRGAGVLTDEPFRVGITVTRDLEEAGYGDWVTAHHLGDELAGLGWQVVYLERYRDAWYAGTEQLDAVIVLHDLFDVRRVRRPGLVTVAWVRNWTQRWIGQPWIDDVDLVVASSAAAAAELRAGTNHDPVVLPLATTPPSASPADDGASRSEVVFTGNFWGDDPRILGLLEAIPDLAVYGKGWDAVPEAAGHWRGRLAHDQLPGLYRRSLVVVDQTAGPTREHGALNSRVFEAAAEGALVVTDQVEGAAEVFGDLLPTWRTPDEAAALVAEARRDPGAARARAARLRERVVAEHTYARRAQQFRDLVEARCVAPRLALLTSCPDRSVAPTWGDWHLAEALARRLAAAGHRVDVLTRDEWDGPARRAADVAVHLKGRGVVAPIAGQGTVLWIISHPEEVTDAECEAADLVLTASPRFTEHLRDRTTTPVRTLLQATDDRRFRPVPVDPSLAHDLVLVGNSRFTQRPIVRDALAAGLQPTIYGANWEGIVDPSLVAETFVPNEDVPRVYASARVVLNDHWEGMRQWGFVSNRVFDVLACGGCLVSDDLPELEALFGEAVARYRAPDELADVVTRLLAAPDERAARGAAGRAAVLAGHTFGHRADELLAILREVGMLPEGSSSPR